MVFYCIFAAENYEKFMQQVKIQDYAKYIGLSLLLKGNSISPLKLQKLLYYHQAWHMVFFGRDNTLFVEKPHAWVNGPVYPTVYHKYKEKVPGMCDHLNFSHFGCEEECNDCIAKLAAKMNLENKEIALADNINLLYGSKTQNQLILMTHCELPWCEQREGLLPYEYSDKEISLDTMYKYYSERYNKNRRK